MKLGFNKHEKVTKLFLQGKFLSSSKSEKWGHFGAPEFTLSNFSVNLLKTFLKLFQITGIKNLAKVRALDFQGKFLLCPKSGKQINFRPKINTFEFFSLGFSDIIQMTDIKKCLLVFNAELELDFTVISESIHNFTSIILVNVGEH